MRIVEPVLIVEPVAEHPGERRVGVSYVVETDADDPLLGLHLEELAIVEAVDEHDAPVRPTRLKLALSGDLTVDRPGRTERRLDRQVHRVDLDVEQDWWRTDTGGGTEPIAEFADHLAATITVTHHGLVAAQATTPVLTGSWGALGSD